MSALSLAFYRWCDQELVKFASTFGGSRILGRLALSPSTFSAGTDATVKSGGDSSQGTTHTMMTFKPSTPSSLSIPEMKEQLRKAEEVGDYALAGSLRRKLSKAEELRREERSRGETSKSDSTGPKGAENDRQVSVLYVVFPT